MKISRIIDRTMITYAGVTFCCWVFGTGLMFLLYNAAHLGYWLSSALNYIISGLMCYFLNKRFTFRKKGNTLRLLAKYTLHMAVCYLFAYSLAPYLGELLEKKIHTSVAGNGYMVIGTVLYAILNYFGQRYVVFRTSKKNGEAEKEEQ